MQTQLTTTHVAVGVIIDADNNILIALRPRHSHQGGLWEFPGGKVEPNETVQQALARELYEELGIHGRAYRPLINVRHNYGDKIVLLDVWWVDEFEGKPVGREGQPIKWVPPEQLSTYAFPAANEPIVNAIQQINSVLPR